MAITVPCPNNGKCGNLNHLPNSQAYQECLAQSGASTQARTTTTTVPVAPTPESHKIPSHILELYKRYQNDPYDGALDHYALRFDDDPYRNVLDFATAMQGKRHTHPFRYDHHGIIHTSPRGEEQTAVFFSQREGEDSLETAERFVMELEAQVTYLEEGGKYKPGIGLEEMQHIANRARLALFHYKEHNGLDVSEEYREFDSDEPPPF